MAQQSEQAPAPRWDAGKAWQWYGTHPWICGFNYVPSAAVNSTEMWQHESFDLPTIERELGWAAEIGLNSCRVFVQYLVWKHDPYGLVERFARFLDIAGRHGISTMLILFDDCAFAGKQPYLGAQDMPVPGIHNSGWTPSPGHDLVVDRSAWPELEAYVSAMVGRFGDDGRIIAWDLYNEPGNSHMGDRSLPLLQQAFGWARACTPQQPLTVGLWRSDLAGSDVSGSDFAALNETALTLSDITTFHTYAGLAALEQQLDVLKALGRPVLCTEWMSRTRDSLFRTHLPVFHQENVGCYFWGLVNGKTQTHFSWGSLRDATAPEMWFHDLLGLDGKPYLEEEIEIIGRYTGRRGSFHA